MKFTVDNKELDELRRKAAAAEKTVANARGRVEAVRDSLLADESFIEELRVATWANTRGHGMTYDVTTGSFGNVPEGWPEGVDDPKGFAREYLDRRVKIDGDAPVTLDEPSPGVAEFRKLIGD